MKRVLSILVSLLLSACAPSGEAIQKAVDSTLSAIPPATAYPTLTSYPTYTKEPTYTPQATYTKEPIQVIVVTPTFTEAPLYTPTITITPPPTQDPLTADKEPGNYLVGTDIAPGVWRNNGQSSECYWKVSSRTGDIIDNYFGMGGGTMYIPKNAFSVELHEECGTWTYLGPP
jgi:hypothetical protein